MGPVAGEGALLLDRAAGGGSRSKRDSVNPGDVILKMAQVATRSVFNESHCSAIYKIASAVLSSAAAFFAM